MKNLLKIISVLLFFTACRKEPVIENRLLDTNLKASFNNKPGSYWIYKDSLTGELDSLYLVFNELSVYIDGPNNNIKYQNLLLLIESKHLGKDTLHDLIYSLNFSSKSNCTLSCGLKSNAISPLDIKFSYPFSNISAFYETDMIGYNGMKESLLIAGHQHENISVFSQFAKTNVNEYSKGFWSDSIGLVKMQLMYSTPIGEVTKVLELQRWHLIK